MFKIILFVALINPLVAYSQMKGQPANSYVYGSNWYCNEGYKKKGNRCASIFENMTDTDKNNDTFSREKNSNQNSKSTLSSFELEYLAPAT